MSGTSVGRGGRTEMGSFRSRRIPQRVPLGWKSVTLGDLVDTKSGNSSLIKGRLSTNSEEGLFPAFSASGQDVWTNDAEWHADGVVVSAVGARCGKTFLARGSWTAIANTHVLIPKSSVDPKWLWHLTNDETFWIKGGTAQPFVKIGASKSLGVLLPPLEEQRRIAAVLDAAEALQAKRREALAKLDTLTQAIFIDMFGDPVSNSRGWRDDQVLADVAEVRSGITKGRKTRSDPLTAVPYLAVVNVQDGFIVLDPLKSIEATAAEIRKYSLKVGDILLTEGGDADKLGRGAVWDGQVNPCIHQNHVFRVRITDDNMSSEFLSLLLGSQRGKRYFLRMAKQTTGIASINLTQLRAFPLLEPPRAVQEEFLNRLSSVQAVDERLRHSVDHLDTLFASLQQRAFRGEL